MAAETNAESTANPQDTEAAQKDLPSPPTDATAPEVEPTAEKTTEANTEPSKQSLPAIVTTAEQTPTINDQSPSSPDDVASNASNLDFLETSSSASSFFAGPSRGPSPTPPVSVPYLMAIPGQPVAPAPGVAWQVPVPGPMFVQPYGMVPPPAFATIGPQGNPVYPIVSPMPPQMASSPDTRTLRPASAMVYPAAGPVINGTASRSSPRAMSMMPGGSSSSPPLAAGSPPLQQNPMSVPADSPSLGTSYNAPGGLVGEGTANGTTFATTGTVAAGGSSSSVAASSSNNINGNGNREERLSIDSSFTFNSEATLDGGMITDDTASEVGSVSSAQIAMSSSVVERMELMKVRAKKAKQKQQCFDAARFIIDNVQNVDKSEQKAYCEVAVRALKKLSQQGFPDAQYMLANLYIGGIPGFQERHKPDYAKAFALYASAAKKEHPEALFHVGLCYEQGAGTQQSAARALHNYRKAAVR
ncbi:hypothetical protein HK102_005250 [Quaeritorhiza haematococci]|nr:hypothetical protein HK102_005250 [Quaeritorhiza haematococci]